MQQDDFLEELRSLDDDSQRERAGELAEQVGTSDLAKQLEADGTFAPHRGGEHPVAQYCRVQR
jgi:hypothetical protein